MTYKNLYHLTSVENVHQILKGKFLTYGKGKQRGGYNEKQISFADFLSRYLYDFGNVCFEFKAEDLFEENKIYPFDYGIEEQHFYLPDGFPAMPFWESEWQAKKVKFEYNDINKMILFSDALGVEEIDTLVDLVGKLDIRYKIIEFSKLPEPNYNFFIRRYLHRMTMKKRR